MRPPSALIIDDDRDFRESLELLVQREGFETRSAGTLAESRERLAGGTPDIIPFLEDFLDLEERQVYQGTRLRPDYPVIPFPVDLESLVQEALGNC